LFRTFQFNRIYANVHGMRKRCTCCVDSCEIEATVKLHGRRVFFEIQVIRRNIISQTGRPIMRWMALPCPDSFTANLDDARLVIFNLRKGSSQFRSVMTVTN